MMEDIFQDLMKLFGEEPDMQQGIMQLYWSTRTLAIELSSESEEEEEEFDSDYTLFDAAPTRKCRPCRSKSSRRNGGRKPRRGGKWIRCLANRSVRARGC